MPLWPRRNSPILLNWPGMATFGFLTATRTPLMIELLSRIAAATSSATFSISFDVVLLSTTRLI